MPIFKINKDNLTPVKEVSIKLEKDLQNITEKNLKVVFGLDFVSSEFALHNFRIDTLAFNKETRSFVIIEYKRDRSFSVVDQGFAYLSLMLNNKADFILEYNESTKNNLRKDNVDWSQSRVLFLAQSFTTYQQNAINFKDLPIELWEVSKYDNDLFLYNQLKSTDSSETIKTLSKNKTIENVSKEVRVYTLEDHRNKADEEGQELLDKLREEIFKISDDIKEGYTPEYIKYFVNTTFVGVHVRKKWLVMELRVDEKTFKDPKKLAKDISNRNWTVTREIKIDNMEVLNYAIGLIQQAYKTQ